MEIYESLWYIVKKQKIIYIYICGWYTWVQCAFFSGQAYTPRAGPTLGHFWDGTEGFLGHPQPSIMRSFPCGKCKQPTYSISSQRRRLRLRRIGILKLGGVCFPYYTFYFYTIKSTQTSNICQGTEYIVSLLQSYIINTLCIEWKTEQQSIGTDPIVFLLSQGPYGPSPLP